ncbi:hypothetical protein Tco_0296369 [Tanacetum coccineum]
MVLNSPCFFEKKELILQTDPAFWKWLAHKFMAYGKGCGNSMIRWLALYQKVTACSNSPGLATPELMATGKETSNLFMVLSMICFSLLEVMRPVCNFCTYCHGRSGGSKLVAVVTLLGLSLVLKILIYYWKLDNKQVTIQFRGGLLGYLISADYVISADSISSPSGEVVNHTLPQVTTVNNTAKFPYLKVGEYDVWAMKMQNYISSTDLQCWNVVMKGNHARPTTTDSNGKIVYRDPVSADEYLVLQRESKARSTLISALPDEHMSDFNHMIDAKDIWDAIKAKFGSNEESRKLQKTMLKQAFAEFKMTSEEGLDKCYERMQKMLTQMNSLKIKPEQEEVNMCFLRALPESWRQVSLSLRARGGLDLLTFEDLYSKLKFLESDVRGYARPSHAAFVGSSSTSSLSTKSPLCIMRPHFIIIRLDKGLLMC